MTTSARVGAGGLACSSDPCVCCGGVNVRYGGGGPKMSGANVGGRGISLKPLPKNLGGGGGDAQSDRVIVVGGGGGVSPTNIT